MVVPEDLGRVFLNIFNNAFYSMNERAKLQQDHIPVLRVSTARAGQKIFISIEDNGTGIPQHIIEKMFQPFFTTKPTGQGTGLGLSLSYDIIKAYGGQIKVESKEGKGSKFIIGLPVK